MAKKEYKIAVIAGDGIGKEVIQEGKKVIEAVSSRYGFNISWIDYPFGADYYLEKGELLPDSALKEMEGYDAIYLGAIGDPRVKPGILERGILLKIRFYFDQYVNLRPIKLYEGVRTPLKDRCPADINFYVVRENTEDFYVGLGGVIEENTSKVSHKLLLKRCLYELEFDVDIKKSCDCDVSYQIGVISKEGAKRIIRYAFDLAKSKGLKKVTSVDKVNAMPYIYSVWRKAFEEVSLDYPDIEKEYSYVDAITMWMVKSPQNYDVIVTPNMFGDIITDLGAIIQGGLGIAAGGNINPQGVSMFEPIHGSAPKYKGKQEINPIATILAGAMMLDFLGEKKAAACIERAVSDVLKEGKFITKDLGGTSKTYEVGDAIAKKV